MSRLIFLLLTSVLFLNCQHANAQNAPASVVQLPVFGVKVDGDGVLTEKLFAEPGGELFIARARAAKADLDADLFRKTRMRKVSLRKLESAIADLISKGKEPTDAMKNLAGLQRIEYVFVYPESKDIVIAGPAEGWLIDAAGRTIGVSTARPVVRLDELMVALRTMREAHEDKWVGCTIDPTREGLLRLAEFNQTIPRSVRTQERSATATRMADGMATSLGMADVKTFGMESTNPLSHVLIEADYRMKMIAIGLEPPPIRMATFASLLKNAPNTMQRWWFSPEYECIKVTEDRLALQLFGDGVRLLTEDYQLTKDGRLEAIDKSTEEEKEKRVRKKAKTPSELFSQAFTKKYEKIAEASPVFAQLRNAVDLLVIATYFNKESIFEKANWKPTLLLDEEAMPVEIMPAIKKAPCAANAFWKGSRLLAPAGGGVSIKPSLAFEKVKADDSGSLKRAREAVKPAEEWWWN